MTDADLTAEARSVVGDERVELHARPSYLAFAGRYTLVGLGVTVALTVVLAVVLGLLGLVVGVLLSPILVVLSPILIVLLSVLDIGGLAPSLVGVAQVAVGALVLIAGVGFLGAYLPYRNAEYVVTTDRVVRFGGILGRDYEAIDRADVRRVDVDAGVVDGLLGTGTVEVSAPPAAVSLRSIRSPYEVAEMLDDGG